MNKGKDLIGVAASLRNATLENNSEMSVLMSRTKFSFPFSVFLFSPFSQRCEKGKILKPIYFFSRSWNSLNKNHYELFL